MKEAMFYTKKENNAVVCSLCPHNCEIPESSFGLCLARKNINGTLYSLTYETPSAVHIDPVEKKPLFHFFPGKEILSIGSFGCNFKCRFCQNYDISMAKPEQSISLSPKQIISIAKKENIPMIAYTYNEPTVFYEYVYETAKLAKKSNIKNVLVTNGYINKKPLLKLLPFIDAANIDFKSYDNSFYKSLCFGSLKPVLDTMKLMNGKIWIEITNLIIPNENDNIGKIREIAKWIRKNLGNVPLHFSRFFPMYKMLDRSPTPKETLVQAKEAAQKHLDYVYIGNVNLNASDTICPKCKKTVIERKGYQTRSFLKNGRCPFCNHKIPGVF